MPQSAGKQQCSNHEGCYIRVAYLALPFQACKRRILELSQTGRWQQLVGCHVSCSHIPAVPINLKSKRDWRTLLSPLPWWMMPEVSVICPR